MKTISEIVEKLEIETDKLNDKNDNEKIKKDLLKELKFFKSILQVGIIKKINNMSKEQLLNIAYKTFDSITLDANNSFIEEYQKDLEYLKNYNKDLDEKRNTVLELEYTLEAKLFVLFDDSGEPKLDIIIDPETSKIIKEKIKNGYPKTKDIRIKARILRNIFKDYQLYQLGLWHMPNKSYPGSAAIRPNDYLKNDIYKKYSNEFITIETDYEGADRLTSMYSYEEAKIKTEKIEKYKTLYEKMLLKQRIETDENFLREYVKQIIVDPEYINLYMDNAIITTLGGNEYSMRQLYNSAFANIEEDEFNKYMSKKQIK